MLWFQQMKGLERFPLEPRSTNFLILDNEFMDLYQTEGSFCFPMVML